MNKKNISILIVSLVALVMAIGMVVTREVSANWPALRTGQATTTATTATALSSVEIPEGTTLVVKAKTANTGVVTLGYSAATAATSSTSYFSLYPGESIGLDLTNANLLYFNVTVTGEGIEYITETNY